MTVTGSVTIAFSLIAMVRVTTPAFSLTTTVDSVNPTVSASTIIIICYHSASDSS